MIYLIDIAKNGFLRTAGLSVYMISKKAARIMNPSIRKIGLSNETKKRISGFYNGINMDNVIIFEDSRLPAGLFKDNIVGMTFGNTIYTTHKNCQGEYFGLLNLMHEMVHVEQMNALGEKEFARQYGQQFIKYGGYSDKMPLESEAYRLVRNLPFNPFYYLKKNPDIDMIAKGSKSIAFIHWLDIGIDEGRQGCESFNPSVYLSRNPDIETVCGKGNFKAAVNHWVRHGKIEGRKGI
jgi:hypothetical protein